MNYVLDASAILRYIDNEPGAAEVEKLLKKARVGDAVLLMSAVNWGEVLFVVLKAHGVDAMNKFESRLQSLPIQVLAVDHVSAKEAAEIRFRFKVPYADAFAGAVARQNEATIVTADHDFTLVRGAIKVQQLPTKAKGHNP
ncbi:MAG: PIN domain-containing protein [Terriglobales bacterium]